MFISFRVKFEKGSGIKWILKICVSFAVKYIYRQNAQNMSYAIINDQHKFLAWDPTIQINYGPHASKMAGGSLSFTIAPSNFILNSNLIVSNLWLIVSNPWFETRSSLSARNVAHFI